MTLRFLKIILALLVAGLALFYALHNLANLDQALAAIGYVMSQADHATYPGSLVPAISHPAAAWLALTVILVGQFFAGLAALLGGWRMWQVRHASGNDFHQASYWTRVGACTGVIVWFGLFGVVGGAMFQMWQTEVGDASLTGAFWYGATCAFVLIYLSVRTAE